jgi:hypothetical protein
MVLVCGHLVIGARWRCLDVDSGEYFRRVEEPMGWGGFVTQDLALCRLAARMIVLFYDWWSIFVRLVEPDRHLEAITSRPLLLHAIAKRVRHARRTRQREAPSRPEKCGAVDGPATLAANPRESLPSFP